MHRSLGLSEIKNGKRRAGVKKLDGDFPAKKTVPPAIIVRPVVTRVEP
jgi:hypothetical protein